MAGHQAIHIGHGTFAEIVATDMKSIQIWGGVLNDAMETSMDEIEMIVFFIGTKRDHANINREFSEIQKVLGFLDGHIKNLC
jgi:hypothetical protein